MPPYKIGSVPFQSTAAPGHLVRITRSKGATSAPFASSSALGGGAPRPSSLWSTLKQITCATKRRRNARMHAEEYTEYNKIRSKHFCFISIALFQINEYKRVSSKKDLLRIRVYQVLFFK